MPEWSRHFEAEHSESREHTPLASGNQSRILRTHLAVIVQNQARGADRSRLVQGLLGVSMGQHRGSSQFCKVYPVKLSSRQSQRILPASGTSHCWHLVEVYRRQTGRWCSF